MSDAEPDPVRSKLARLLKPRTVSQPEPHAVPLAGLEPGAGLRAPGLGPYTRLQLERRDARRARHVDAASAPVSPGLLSVGDPRELLRCERSGTRARVQRFDSTQLHGHWPLVAALDSDVAALAGSARLPELPRLPLRDALYLDTETTGLGGGSGTYVFLVGLARFDDRELSSWQGFLDSPAGEAALLAETARRIREASCVISFFGKSFDRHRLEDKMRLHGIAPPFVDKPHLDLYWPLRRLYRGRFADCRLRTLEHELAGVQREDDLPGSFAPAAWFDYLAGRPHRLEGVFRHNLEDVKSLCVLLHALSRAATGAS